MSMNNLKTNCKDCFGFCCTALYFSKTEGFPVDKPAGKPCPNLMEDFTCKVHHNLKKLGLKGCVAYDCFGAGQKTAQCTYKGMDWRKSPEKAEEMYKVFLIIHQLHEMLWYMSEARKLDLGFENELDRVIEETEALTMLDPDSLLKLDMTAQRFKVNPLLKQTSEAVRKKYKHIKKPALKFKKAFGGAFDLIGRDLRNTDLRGENLSGAYLIAADLRDMDLSGTDFIGADLRDADLRGTDLSCSLFLSQIQINSAKGDESTKLPDSIEKPVHW